MKLKNLRTKTLGKNCVHFKEIDSTQSEIWRMIQNNSENGSVVMADIQTQGKGTHGRTWYTDEENNIAFSFFLRLNCDIGKLEGLTKQIAYIIKDILKLQYGIDVSIKEPNDIVVNGKKIGGILTETKTMQGKVQYLVVGIGINTSKTNFQEDIKDTATSIKKEFGIEVNVEDFIAEFCNRFEAEIFKRTDREDFEKNS